jgi:hypothetical protein
MGTEEMVVVFRKLLGKLIASELVVGGDAPDHACNLEIEEVSVRGAPGQIRSPISDIADADRVARADEQLDNRTPTGGVALVSAPKAVLDDVVEVAGGVRARHGIFLLDREFAVVMPSPLNGSLRQKRCEQRDDR